MGIYINPPECSKEEWLIENGIPVFDTPSIDYREGYLPVCLVGNRAFTAAAVCPDEREVDAFSDPSDERPKQWFIVPIEKLTEVCPNLAM